jgi:hypothetical protein
MINLATILFNQKSTARVNLLLTCCSYTISIGFHSSCLIQVVGWFSLNLNSHSCNTCEKSQKNTSCRLKQVLVQIFAQCYIRIFVILLCKFKILCFQPPFDLRLCWVPRSKHSIFISSFSACFFYGSHSLNPIQF